MSRVLVSEKDMLSGKTILLERAGASGVCPSCASSLSRIADGFKQLKQQGSELRKKRAFPLLRSQIVITIEMLKSKMSG